MLGELRPSLSGVGEFGGSLEVFEPLGGNDEGHKWVDGLGI